MVISKNRKEENILFIDASQEYENDRKNNILSKEYQNKIIYTYREKKEQENYSRLVTKEEIINNKFDLTIKKYIHKKRKIEIVDREQLAQNVKILKLEQEKLEENIKDVLEVLGYRDIGEVNKMKNEYNMNNKNGYEMQMQRTSKLDYSLIGNRIKLARRRKKMTQEELAEKLFISVSFFSRIERGTSQITLKRLTEICKILGITEGEILNGKYNT